MKTLTDRFDECRGFEERRDWLQAQNKARCQEASRRRKADPAADLSGLEFACVPAEKPESELEWDLDPSRVGR